jgi:hypothetical protein
MYLKISLQVASYTAKQLELETAFRNNAISKRTEFMYNEQFNLIKVSSFRTFIRIHWYTVPPTFRYTGNLIKVTVHDKCIDLRVKRYLTIRR